MTQLILPFVGFVFLAFSVILYILAKRDGMREMQIARRIRMRLAAILLLTGSGLIMLHLLLI